MLEEVKNAKNIKKLQTQGHPKFSHILKNSTLLFTTYLHITGISGKVVDSEIIFSWLIINGT